MSLWKMALGSTLVFAATTCARGTEPVCPDGIHVAGENAAAEAMCGILQSHYANCAGRWTTRQAGESSWRGTPYQQIESPSFVIRTEPLTRTDELNGITFSGAVSFGENMSFRSYPDMLSSTPAWTTWFPLSSKPDAKELTILRQNGEWRLTDPEVLFGGIVPDCDELPPG